MRSAVKFLAPALLASLTLAACGSSSSSSGSSSQATTATPTSATTSPTHESAAVVKTAANSTLGATILVTAHGLTLYHLSGEQNGKFICTSSACLQVWRPLRASAATSTSSVGSIGRVKRPDGTEQVTYKGVPLYTFTQDQQPGQTGGQGINDVGTWSAVTVGSSSAAAPAAAPTTPAEPAQPENSSGENSGGGYGY